MEQLSLTPAHREFPTATAGMPGSCTQSAATGQAQPDVTEIILPASQVENFQLLLPMLTQLNQEERWLAWIDPPPALVQRWQQHHGIVQHQLLILRSSAQHSAQELARRALEAGTCHAVVLWTRGLSGEQLRELEDASVRGHSHGVILRER